MSAFPFLVNEHIVPGQHIRGYPHGTAHEQEAVLHLAVKQYTPRNNPHPKDGDLTIVAAHANGLPKELYEPLWEEILVRVNAAGLSIRNIWIADVAQQGASGALNEAKIGNDPHWFDHAHDLNQIINHFRREMRRPLVGIGHSVGAAAVTYLSLFHPRLFETLILLDPTMFREAHVDDNYRGMVASSKRRTEWPSRDAAAAAFRKSRFYGAWDQRVLARYLKYGLRDLHTSSEHGDVPVTLATTRDQEVFLFVRPVPAATIPASDVQPGSMYPNTTLYRPENVQAFLMLPQLRPSVHYVFGGRSAYSTPEYRADKMRTTGIGIGGSRMNPAMKNAVTQTCIEECGHMVPFEAVEKTADTSAAWLVQAMHIWRQGEERDAQGWQDLSDIDKRTVGKDFQGRLVDGLAKNTPGSDKSKL